MYIKEENGKDIINYQIFKQDNKSRFMEVTNSMFYNVKFEDDYRAPKFIFNFSQYDEKASQGSKIKREIATYVSIEEAVAIAHAFLNINLLERIYKKNQKANKSYIFQIQGGTAPDKLKKQGRERSDGKAESRILVIEPGQSAPFVMTAKVGPGRVDNSHNGIIIPDGKSESYITISFQYEDMIVLANELLEKVRTYKNREEVMFQRNLKEVLKKQGKPIYY